MIRSSMLRVLALVLVGSVSAVAADPPESDWAQWRGPNRDGLSPDTGLLKQWPAEGPKVLWKTTGIGGGYSSVSISGDRIYTMGLTGDSYNLVALNRENGKVLWSTEVDGRPGKERGGVTKYPGTRGTPATDGSSVYALGPYGTLICAEAEGGKVRWKKNLAKEFGGRVPNWGYAESPLLDGDRVVCTPGGGRGTVLALKKESGAVAWQSGGLRDGAQYTSLIPAEIGGVRQYVVLTKQSVSGVAATDGKVVWRAERPNNTPAVIPTPIYRDGIVFVTSGYGGGSCNGYQVTESGGSFSVKEIYSDPQVNNKTGGMILVGDHVYGSNERGRMRCVEFKTGKTVWEHPSVGAKSSIAYADGHFVVRSENLRNGTIALVEASPEAYKEKGRFDLPDPTRSARAAWAHPVVFGGRMYIRNHETLYCYDIKAK